ncbi:branched-chain alpha-keto acid dehydrogenase subunit E2 [Rhodobacter xanthinilyticus]|uniref:Endolytic murein transglycosylase n=1 Tax=Rhodobacter xanthinilyticus TaxID=1850250 RepID=A0A1D9MBS7_9RHOB|nr:endolytic transglycosylase MltG [Rhodobacter xanthinilyticus]AOZ69258.1 branched-chain alpha-keto acid dehydrogenase subunit E2 [Rhodobacter xanthinilyticus]
MWRHIVSNFLTVLIVIMVGLAGLAAWAKKQYEGPGPLAQAVCLRVEQGSNFTRVSQDLLAQGAIRSGYIFRAGADYAGKSKDLKFGSYLVAPGASMQEIVDEITAGVPSSCGTELNLRIGVLNTQLILRELDPGSGQYVEKAKFDPAAEARPEGFDAAASKADVRTRVTVAEGVTSWQVVEGLKAADFLAGEVKAVPPEGSLAPDSYEVKRGSDRQKLIDEMEARQGAILAAAWEARASGLPYETPEEALVMASIVEKETGVPGERGRVASVFVNRLEQGMKLQTDPAVIYGVTKGQGILGRGLRQSELRRETPYNTYVIEGLPPTPICNPGRAAIEAALNPDSTRYLFFVADGTGGHVFAQTLEEHNRNVAKWREIEAQQKASGAAN